MKILIVADQESVYIWDHFDRNHFKDVDLIISCGDLKASYLSFLVTMIPKPLLYIHGNHDVNYITSPPEGCTCIDGDCISFNNLNIAGLGGCIEYSGGPFQFPEQAMQKRVKKLMKNCRKKGGLDILVTHSPSKNVGDGDDWAHKGFECFHSFYDILLPKYHLHGHQHLNYGANSSRIMFANQTTVVNGFGYYILDISENNK
ncbi:MAG: metallophosphoesterase family protein [Cellulosilyticaceae bacterium]